MYNFEQINQILGMEYKRPGKLLVYLVLDAGLTNREIIDLSLDMWDRANLTLRLPGRENAVKISVLCQCLLVDHLERNHIKDNRIFSYNNNNGLSMWVSRHINSKHRFKVTLENLRKTSIYVHYKAYGMVNLKLLGNNLGLTEASITSNHLGRFKGLTLL